MTTLIKVEFSEQSKCVTSQTKVESDEMEAKEVLELCQKLALDAQGVARTMTFTKQR